MASCLIAMLVVEGPASKPEENVPSFEGSIQGFQEEGQVNYLLIVELPKPNQTTNKEKIDNKCVIYYWLRFL